uniref:Uncharacterized protein n=1 Tax=Micrurus lemniscatus lemniscatus TaxID=129467 RepID=A0A2D4IIE7_MICLE
MGNGRKVQARGKRAAYAQHPPTITTSHSLDCCIIAHSRVGRNHLTFILCLSYHFSSSLSLSSSSSSRPTESRSRKSLISYLPFPLSEALQVQDGVRGMTLLLHGVKERN